MNRRLAALLALVQVLAHPIPAGHDSSSPDRDAASRVEILALAPDPADAEIGIGRTDDEGSWATQAPLDASIERAASPRASSPRRPAAVVEAIPDPARRLVSRVGDHGFI